MRFEVTTCQRTSRDKSSCYQLLAMIENTIYRCTKTHKR